MLEKGKRRGTESAGEEKAIFADLLDPRKKPFCTYFGCIMAGCLLCYESFSSLILVFLSQQNKSRIRIRCLRV